MTRRAAQRPVSLAMNARTLVATALVLTSLSVPAQARTGQEGELSGLVASEVQAAGERSVEELWHRSVELREAEGLGEQGELDRRLDEWLGKRAQLPPQALLFVVAARLSGSPGDPARFVDALVPVLEGGEAELAAAAAQLLADRSFKVLAPSRRDDLALKMLERAEDRALAPKTRLAFAKSAFLTGGGKERLKANKILRGFLE